MILADVNVELLDLSEQASLTLELRRAGWQLDHLAGKRVAFTVNGSEEQVVGEFKEIARHALEEPTAVSVRTTRFNLADLEE